MKRIAISLLAVTLLGSTPLTSFAIATSNCRSLIERTCYLKDDRSEFFAAIQLTRHECLAELAHHSPALLGEFNIRSHHSPYCHLAEGKTSPDAELRYWSCEIQIAADLLDGTNHPSIQLYLCGQ